MTEQNPPPSSEGQQPPTQGQPAEGQPPEGTGTPPVALTPEEVENQWKHRVSQKDRAHAAAEQALRDENDALKRQMAALSAPRAQSNGQSGQAQGSDPEVEALRQQLEAQRRETEAERQARVLETRRAKYPALARDVGDAGIDIFKTSDEATLAKLNARLDDGSSSGTFASTSPRRPAAVPTKSINEMNKAELEAEMQRQIERGALRREQR